MKEDDTKKKLPLYRLLKNGFLLFLIVPFVISIVIHLGFLYYSTYIKWETRKIPGNEKEPIATDLLEKKIENTLQFQEPKKLDEPLPLKNKLTPKEMPPVKSEKKMSSTDLPAERPIRLEVDATPTAIPGTHSLDLVSTNVTTTDHRWFVTSTGRQVMHTGTEQLSAGSFTRHIQELRESGFDIVFVFDATVSMGRCIQEVKHKIANLARTYKKLVPTCRIGMVAYRDHGDEFVTRSHPLTFGIMSLEDFLSGIQAEGGGDREEAVEEGLRVAIDEMNWNKESSKIILLIGDAPPHRKDMQQSVSLIKKFRSSMNGRLAALDTSMPVYYEDMQGEGKRSEKNTAVMEEFVTLAEAGGGEAARLINEEKVVKQMLVLVFGGRWEMYLNEFMKNL